MEIKRYWTIGELAEELNVATSLIRFWEGIDNHSPIREFLNPHKKDNGIREYKSEDRTELLKAFYLVKIWGFTLEGARDAWGNVWQLLQLKPWTKLLNAMSKKKITPRPIGYYEGAPVYKGSPIYKWLRDQVDTGLSKGEALRQLQQKLDSKQDQSKSINS